MNKMNAYPHDSHVQLRSDRGFALLVTIVLVAFLVLILVALATFSRVETQVADNSQQIAKARENAIMALNIAVGQLQKHAGPDRRATGRGDLVSNVVKERFITGIWDETPTKDEPLVWLVSKGEDPTNSAVNDALTAVLAPGTGTAAYDDTASAPWVFLVWDNSVANSDYRIRLEKQPIRVPPSAVPGAGSTGSDVIIGNYAYWVSDEGIKASAALNAGTSISYNNDGTGSSGQGDNWSGAPNEKRNRLAQFALPRTRLDRTNLFGSSFDIYDNKLPDVLQGRQLLFISGAPTLTVWKEKFHDVTTLSQGVLADVSATTTDGRLKEDLSDIANPRLPALLPFQQARVAPSTGFVATYTPNPDSPTIGDRYPAYPVLTEFGIRFWYSISGTDIMLNYIIDAELWNPYAADVQLPGSVNKFQMEITNLPGSVDLVDDLGTAYPGVGLGTVLPSPFVVEIDPSLIWTAGEIKRVSGSAGSLLVAGSSGTQDTISTTVAVTGTPTEISTVNNIPAVNNLVVVLQMTRVAASTDDIQTYDPQIAYSAGNGISNSNAASFGYGFQLNEDLRVWTSGDGSVSPQADPRRGTLQGTAYYEPNATAVWQNDPAANNASLALSTEFTGITSPDVIVLFDLPRQEITSLGMFVHAKETLPYELGNTWGTNNNYYDRYFISTVPRFASTAEWNPESNKPLPNRYIKVHHPESSATISPTDLQNYERAAMYLLQTGSFNINSTSIQAWEAILGSKLLGWEHEGVASGGISLDNAFFRLPHGAQQLTKPLLGSATDPLDDVDSINSGGRQLEENEIERLAAEIVNEIKIHTASNGPYRTLARFIDDGVIERAIVAAGINSAPANGSLSTNFMGTSAALTQADVVNAIAPFMTPRTDTFMIRAYGDVRNPMTDSIEGRAWCEAVVQRLPEMVDSSLDALEPNPPSAPYFYFGRKFKIISFRWLTFDDL